MGGFDGWPAKFGKMFLPKDWGKKEERKAYGSPGILRRGGDENLSVRGIAGRVKLRLDRARSLVLH